MVGIMVYHGTPHGGGGIGCTVVPTPVMSDDIQVRAVYGTISLCIKYPSGVSTLDTTIWGPPHDGRDHHGDGYPSPYPPVYPIGRGMGWWVLLLVVVLVLVPPPW